MIEREGELMKINEKRFLERMDAINGVAMTEEGGMMRLALSDADKKARDLLKLWMVETGMDVRIDDLGSMVGYLPGSDKDALAIGIGSHLDTQPNGGKYDGLYGVLAGLEAVCTLKDEGIITKSPLAIINWTNEEGARFVPPMLASGAVAGVFDAEWVHERKDNDGIKYIDELKRIGYLGSSDNRFTKAKAYIEPHIEQGPVLDMEKLSLGVVTGALGITGLDITITGEANHAGTTPMGNRKDALMTASEVILELREKIIEYGDPAVITIGIINAKPASKNIVPGEVYFSIDMRHDNDTDLIALEEDVKKIIKDVCKKNKLQVDIERYWKAEPVHFDKKIVNIVDKVVKNETNKSTRITSGAGHDAVFMDRIMPTGMLFIPSINGMSHCPQEETKIEDQIIGVMALTEIILEIDK